MSNPSNIEKADAGQKQREVKSVEYAYPSSPRAVELGRSKTGCWFVSLLLPASPERKVQRHYLTKEEAIAFAETLPQEYDVYSEKPANRQMSAHALLAKRGALCVVNRYDNSIELQAQGVPLASVGMTSDRDAIALRLVEGWNRLEPLQADVATLQDDKRALLAERDALKAQCERLLAFTRKVEDYCVRYDGEKLEAHPLAFALLREARTALSESEARK